MTFYRTFKHFIWSNFCFLLNYKLIGVNLKISLQVIPEHLMQINILIYDKEDSIYLHEYLSLKLDYYQAI